MLLRRHENEDPIKDYSKTFFKVIVLVSIVTVSIRLLILVLIQILLNDLIQLNCYH